MNPPPTARDSFRSPLARGGRWRRSAASGVVVVEFALVFPILLLVLFGVVQFSILFSDYQSLISATDTGLRVFAISRGSDSVVSDTQQAIQKATGGRLDSSRLAVVSSIASADNGVQLSVVKNVTSGGAVTATETVCSTDAACATLLADYFQASDAGAEVVVRTKYKPALMFGQPVFGLWADGAFRLTSTVKARIQ